ncbi:hypothetical protein [Agathobaculum desmolans]|uniref:hypothetical protein n=1 Tax=Agathobaculum desmolans TaxID=39484 RepID=UPI003994B4C6
MVPPPLARPRRAGARIPPPAGGGLPRAPEGVRFAGGEYRPRRAGARIPPPAGGRLPRAPEGVRFAGGDTARAAFRKRFTAMKRQRRGRPSRADPQGCGKFL